MSVIIVQRTIAGLSENAAQINTDQMGRNVPLPVNWQKVRVGLRLHFTDSGADIVTPQFAVGLGHGTTAMVGDPLTDHFVGAYFSGANWLRTAGPPPYYTTGAVQPAKRIGNVWTNGAAALAPNVILGAGASTAAADRYIFFVDFLRATPNWKLALYYANAVQADTTSATFLSFLPVNSPSSGYVYSTARELAVDETTNGKLDTVQIFWDHADSRPELCDVAVSVLA